MTDKQKLNSLNRFRKQPGRLILEEHSHCEVPAGCGGVVLRWRNPNSALPVTIYLYTPVEATCLLDGNPLPSGRLALIPGKHVLAVALEDVDLSLGLIMFAAIHDPKEYQRTPPAQVSKQEVKIVSEADGTWKFSLQEPPAPDWTTFDFEDSDWPALGKVKSRKADWQEFGAYPNRQCHDLGASCLGLPIPARAKKEIQLSWWQKLLGRRIESIPEQRGRIWIRKVFEIPAPEVS